MGPLFFPVIVLTTSINTKRVGPSGDAIHDPLNEFVKKIHISHDTFSRNTIL